MKERLEVHREDTRHVRLADSDISDKSTRDASMPDRKRMVGKVGQGTYCGNFIVIDNTEHPFVAWDANFDASYREILVTAIDSITAAEYIVPVAPE